MDGRSTSSVVEPSVVMGPTEVIEIAILEPDPNNGRWLARVLQDAGYWPLLWQSEIEFFRDYDDTRAACLIADDSMPVLSGTQLLLLLNRFGCRRPTIFLSAAPTIEKTVYAIRGGAVDFMPKPVRAEDLLGAVRSAVANRPDREILERRQTILGRFLDLTPREREVLEYIAAGRLNKQAAAFLGVGEKTVKVHRSRMMRKLGVRTLANLVQVANEVGLFSREVKPAAALATWQWEIEEDRVTGNRALASMFQQRDAASRGAPLSAFVERVHPEDAVRMRASIEEAITSHKPFQSQYRVVADSGAERHVLACGRVIFDARGNPVRFPGVAVDLASPAVPR